LNKNAYTNLYSGGKIEKRVHQLGKKLIIQTSVSLSRKEKRTFLLGKAFCGKPDPQSSYPVKNPV